MGVDSATELNLDRSYRLVSMSDIWQREPILHSEMTPRFARIACKYRLPSLCLAHHLESKGLPVIEDGEGIGDDLAPVEAQTGLWLG